MVTGGPMLRGRWRTEDIGSGTDNWRFWAERRAGRLSEEEFCEIEACLSRSAGHCMVMGTASTMASMAETLGMTLPGNAAIPAADSRRMALAEMSGRRIMEMVREDLKPSRILTREAFDNAIRTGMAIGGSTNAIIHLLALAGRAGVDLPLTRFDELSRTTPMLLNVRPSGQVPDGGLLLRGRAAGGAEGAAAAAARRRAHRDRQVHRGQQRRTRSTTTRT